MKIYNPIGSKERLVEMFQRVNKVKLNEEFSTNSSSQVVENAFNQLVNNQLKIQNTNNQINDNESFVELNCVNNAGDSIVFRFKASSSQGEQEGVFSLDNVVLIEFVQKKSDGTTLVEMDENSLKDFNSQHGNELIDVVSNYVDFDEEMPETDELYQEAVKLIDKVPYNVGTERFQKHDAFADKKPTNSAVRVDSPELNSFVNEDEPEMEDDPLAMPTDYDDVDMKKDLENDYDEVDKSYVGDFNVDDNEPAPDEQELYSQAFENLMARNKTSKNLNYYPTKPEIESEVERIQKSMNPEQEKDELGVHMAKGKKRVYPTWADKYLSENDLDVDAVEKSYFNMTSPDFKSGIIQKAIEIIENKLGAKVFSMPKDEYKALVKNVANRIYQSGLMLQNESEYPSSLEIPKVIEPKKNYPKEQKKRHQVKKLKVKENDENDGMSLEPETDDIYKLAQDREEQGDQIKGGLGDDKSPLEFEPEQIKLGMKVEMEHTDDPMVALEIALDHLTEDPKYYTVKDDPEASAQANASMEASEEEPHESGAYVQDGMAGEKDRNEHPIPAIDPDFSKMNMELDSDDKELTDTLLGYKPKNVGDVDEEIVGAKGAESVVGGESSTSDSDDEYKKYQEYEKKEFNGLPDNEKEEYFKLWTKYKK